MHWQVTRHTTATPVILFPLPDNPQVLRDLSCSAQILNQVPERRKGGRQVALILSCRWDRMLLTANWNNPALTETKTGGGRLHSSKPGKVDVGEKWNGEWRELQSKISLPIPQSDASDFVRCGAMTRAR